VAPKYSGPLFFWGGEETKISRNNNGMKIKRQRRNAENAEGAQRREGTIHSTTLRTGRIAPLHRKERKVGT